MDGNHLELAIEKWLRSNYQKVVALLPVSNHINELVNIVLPKEDSLNLSIKAYRILVHSTRNLGTPVKPGLVIPLKSKFKNLSLQIPKSRDELIAHLDDEPPSLYLEAWEQAKKFIYCEEYRVPLEMQFLEDLDKNCFIYYREHRYSLAILNDWEYGRGIYLEYYPDGRFES
jgi:hypothetical protein